MIKHKKDVKLKRFAVEKQLADKFVNKFKLSDSFKPMRFSEVR